MLKWVKQLFCKHSFVYYLKPFKIGAKYIDINFEVCIHCGKEYVVGRRK